MNKLLICISLCLCPLYTFADGYINENGVIFVSSSDPDESPWREKLKCSPQIQPGSTAKTWSVQYLYPDQKPLTSSYITSKKPAVKAVECEHQVHFPDDIQGDGVFESFYPNTKPRSRIEYTYGMYNGKLTFWFANGLKEQESTIRNGISDGEYRIWHPNGQLALSMGYKNDMQHGMKQRWYADGKPWTYVRFEQGVMNGELKQWFENGKPEREGYYRNGQRHGAYKAWFSDGKPEAVLNYQAGQIVSAQCWNESGKSITGKACALQFKDEE